MTSDSQLMDSRDVDSTEENENAGRVDNARKRANGCL